MAQLIQMRQRIKAVETIKKITHAMRLISMSTHTRLRAKQDALNTYQQAISSLFYRVKNHAPEWHNQIIYPTHEKEKKQLIILVGSQKGLCGNFNAALFRFFEKNIDTHNAHIIGIGKKAVDFLKSKRLNPSSFYNEFTATMLPLITRELTSYIAQQEQPFTEVIMVSNKLKTFFIQKPSRTRLIPFETEHTTESDEQESYTWEQEPNELLNILALQCLEAQIHYLLFASLLAEQAARFLSMDSSTRNAENLLEITQLHYNKLRQSKITKELTELTGSF